MQYRVLRIRGQRVTVEALAAFGQTGNPVKGASGQTMMRPRFDVSLAAVEKAMGA
jgi:hypothetical protein